jgi:hypothetical protein
MHPAPPPKPIRAAPIALWRVAEAFLHTLHNLFGAPEDVVFRHTLTRGPYLLLLSWIRVGEALLRRLLLIEAASLPKPNTRHILWPTRKKRVRRMIEFFDDKPEDWRVSFRCFQSERAALRQAQRVGVRSSVTLSLSKGDVAPPSFHSVWPLAERYEALLRVFNDPTAYAKRLAKRLYASAVKALRSLIREPREAPHRIDLYDEFERTCEIASQHFLNTS